MRIASLAAAFALVSSTLYADPLQCTMTGYKALPGLSAAVADNTLALTWDGDKNQEVRLRLIAQQRHADHPRPCRCGPRARSGRPSRATSRPSTRVVSGLRRATDQQLKPLHGSGRRDHTRRFSIGFAGKRFWDAPLNVPGDDVRARRFDAARGTASRTSRDCRAKPEEITRAAAVYQVRGCDVKTNGARLEVSFPGVKLGVFDGRLEYTIYKGSSLIRQAIVAKTEEKAVAYKYDAGLKGLTLQPKDADGVAHQHVEPMGGLPVRRPHERLARPVEDREPHPRGRGAGRCDRRLPAAAQLLLVARDRVQPRLQLVSQGQRRVLRVRRRGRPRVKRIRHGRATVRRIAARTSRSIARAPARGSAWPCISTSSPDSGPGHHSVGARLHARRSLQGDPRLSGDGDAFPHRHGAASAAARWTRPDDSRFRLDEGRGRQHLRAD